MINLGFFYNLCYNFLQVIMMSELLAPAGSYEALVAAISNGADAIYLGMQQFGARAYASNFDQETFLKAIQYAHLRNVKIYVTMNTIVFENELEQMKKTIDFLYHAKADGIIIQDLAVFQYVVSTYPDLEAHCSTQMGIDDIEGTRLFKSLGAKRVVLARETPIQQVKEIKKAVSIPLEIFIHGALCVSYSGNCLMSGLIGYRSGNRGRCVGSCRKEYQLIDKTTNQSFEKCYLLSMKDLNTIDHIQELKNIDSLKIEGRMKEPFYVANVVAKYREALDGTISTSSKQQLEKTFHRTFTKGYLFGEDKKDITNIEKPNNYGYYIGKIKSKKQNLYELELIKELKQNDVIRIDHNKQEINLTAIKLYDKNLNYIHTANKQCFLKLKEDLSIGDKVYKTKDAEFYQEIEKTYPREYQRFPIDITIYAYENAPLMVDAVCEKIHFHYEDGLLEKAKQLPTTKELCYQQFSRLNDTVYQINHLSLEDNGVFIPVKLLNEAKKAMVEYFNQERLKRTQLGRLKQTPSKPIVFEEEKPSIAVSVTTKEQYEAAIACGVKIIYDESNTIKRNEAHYTPKSGMVLTGGYGGFEFYRQTNEVITDYSLNVVNASAVYLLHLLGAKRVTLSYEINKSSLEDLLASYFKQNQGYPNLEMIVYGRAPLLVTKYCPLKKMNQCGTCKTHHYTLKDNYEEFPILNHKDCSTTLLNSKTLNLIDELKNIHHINVFRLAFTIESKEETIQIIQQFQNQLENSLENLFNSKTDTRGHFKKEIL